MPGQFGLKLGSAGAASDTTVGIADFPRMRQERLAKAQAAMKKNGIAAALLLRPDNIRYATSIRGANFVERLSYVVAFAEHEPILYNWLGRSGGDTPWLKPENVRVSTQWAEESPGREATLETAKKFASEIKADLKEKGLDKEKLGYDGYLDEPGRQALTEAGIQLVNAQPVLLEARAVKTQDEINCMHMAAVIADTAHYAMYQAIKPGVRHRDIVAVGYDTIIRAGGDIDRLAIPVMTGGMVGGMGGDRIVQVGDVITIDIVRATYMGYNTCYYRNYVVGRKPTDREKDLHKRELERMYKVLDMIKPGVSTADCAKYWMPATERGHESEWYMWCDDLAHGMGLNLYEYPIINRLWSLDHPMTIEKGMTMAIECMEFDLAIGRTKLEEMIVVTDTGVEIFSRMPVKELMIAGPIITADGDIASA